MVWAFNKGEGFESKVEHKDTELEDVCLEGAVGLLFELLRSHVEVRSRLALNQLLAVTTGDLLTDTEVSKFDLEGQAAGHRRVEVSALVG